VGSGTIFESDDPDVLAYFTGTGTAGVGYLCGQYAVNNASTSLDFGSVEHEGHGDIRLEYIYQPAP